MHKLFISLLDSDSSFKYFRKNISYYYKKYFEQIVIACNHEEFKKIRLTYDQKMKNNALTNKMDAIERKFNEVNELSQ